MRFQGNFRKILIDMENLFLTLEMKNFKILSIQEDHPAINPLNLTFSTFQSHYSNPLGKPFTHDLDRPLGKS